MSFGIEKYFLRLMFAGRSPLLSTNDISFKLTYMKAPCFMVYYQEQDYNMRYNFPNVFFTEFSTTKVPTPVLPIYTCCIRC